MCDMHFFLAIFLTYVIMTFRDHTIYQHGIYSFIFSHNFSFVFNFTLFPEWCRILGPGPAPRFILSVKQALYSFFN